MKKIIIHGPQVSKVRIFEALRLYFRLLYCVIMDKIEHIDTSSFEYRHGYSIRTSDSRYLRL